MDILIVTLAVVACVPICAWKSPKYKRRIGIALQASADADEWRKQDYINRVKQLTERQGQ